MDRKVRTILIYLAVPQKGLSGWRYHHGEAETDTDAFRGAHGRLKVSFRMLATGGHAHGVA
jgi:hypothetical protein